MPDILPGGAALHGPTGCELGEWDPVGRVKRRAAARGNTTVPCLIIARRRCACGLKRQPDGSLSLREGESEGAPPGSPLYYLWLQRTLRSVNCLRYVTHGAGAHRGRQSPRTLAPASNIAAAPVPSTYPCRLRSGEAASVQNTAPSARIHAGCPAFRERLDVEAATPAGFPVTGE